MKRFLMLTTTLLAFVSTANAQSLSSAALQNLTNLPTTQRQLCAQDCEHLLEVGAQLRRSGRALPPLPTVGADCPSSCGTSTWYTQAVQHGASAWMRVRAMMVQGNKDSACCESIAKPLVCKAGASCAVGAGSSKGVEFRVQTVPSGTLILRVGGSGSIVRCEDAVSCCPLTQIMKLACPLGLTAGKPNAPCCCAKACSCCEACKAKPTAAVQVLPMPIPCLPAPQSSSATRLQALPPGAHLPPMPWSAPMPATTAWSTQTHATPVPPPPPGARMVIGLPTSSGAKSVAHLVTPDMEVHCQNITHRDGTMILEGNVLLLFKKHAQPMRIEAQRVVVNMRDGSFTVDSNPTPPVLRSSYPAPTMDYYYPSSQQRIIEVTVPSLPR